MSTTFAYVDSVSLRLPTGDQVQAIVRSAPAERRQRCLLLHGNPGSLLDWSELVPLLEPAFDLAVIDLPGFGRSPRSSADPACVSLDRFAECVVAVADALGWDEPFFVVGHSHGGGVAQVAAARYPERIAGIALLGTLGARTHGGYRMLSLPLAELAVRLVGRTLRSPVLRPLGKAILRRSMTRIWSPERVPAQRIEQKLELLARTSGSLTSMVHVAQGRPCERLARAASQIRCPVLLIHGERDALVPVECARTVHDLVQGAGGQSEWRVLSGAGHALLDGRVSEVAGALVPFLSRAVRR